MLVTGEDRQIAQIAMDVIAEISREKQQGQSLVPSSMALTQTAIQQQITQRVQERMVPKQGDLLAAQPLAVAEVVQKTVAVMVEQTIDIPRISVVPKGPVKSGYKAFKLDLSKMNFQPQDMALIGQGLKTGKQILYGESSSVLETRLEDYIVRELINYDDVSYDEHAELIYELSGQAVAHFRTYLKTDEELHNILGNYGKTIAENIHLQMAHSYYEDMSESEVVVSQGFTPLKSCAFTAEGEILPLHQAPDDKGKIAQYVYGGFSKCAYPVQKFHSDTERVLAGLLERDARRWFRPVAGQFNIYYRSGANQPEYVPDFVAATADHNLIIETKAAKDMEAADVKAKADAAATWCKHASEYSQAQGGNERTHPLFRLGQIVATPSVLEHFVEHCTHPDFYIQLHACGQWGSIPAEDARENDFSVLNGFRVLSAHEVGGKRFWIVTEADRSVTTLLFPEEY